MDILTVSEGVLHRLIAGNMGHQTQLDLGVVRIHQNTALRRNEHPADLTAEVGAGGNILQIGLRGAQSAGGRHGHLEGGPDPAVGINGL